MTNIENVSATTNKVFVTKAQTEMAQQDGKDLHEYLNGYTSKNDQKNIAKIIKETNPENIADLLKGFSNRHAKLFKIGRYTGTAIGGGIGGFLTIGASPVVTVLGVTAGSTAGSFASEIAGDTFFKQMNSEYSFPQKQELMMDVAKKCHTYLKNNKNKDTTKTKDILYLERIIKNNEISSNDIKHLDKIVNNLIKE